jgi:hypothetical protein
MGVEKLKQKQEVNSGSREEAMSRRGDLFGQSTMEIILLNEDHNLGVAYECGEENHD